MARLKLSSVHISQAHLCSHLLIRPDVHLDVQIIGIGEITRIEVDGIFPVRSSDVEMAATIAVARVQPDGKVLSFGDG